MFVYARTSRKIPEDHRLAPHQGKLNNFEKLLILAAIVFIIIGSKKNPHLTPAQIRGFLIGGLSCLGLAASYELGVLYLSRKASTSTTTTTPLTTDTYPTLEELHRVAAGKNVRSFLAAYLPREAARQHSPIPHHTTDDLNRLGNDPIHLVFGYDMSTLLTFRLNDPAPDFLNALAKQGIFDGISMFYGPHLLCYGMSGTLHPSHRAQIYDPIMTIITYLFSSPVYDYTDFPNVVAMADTVRKLK